MIPVDLQEFLVEYIDNYLNTEIGLVLKNAEGVESPINVYEQYLPIKKNVKDVSHFPNVRVILSDGGRDSQDAEDYEEAKYFIMAGVYDPDPDRKGYKDCRMLIRKILQKLYTEYILDKKYTLTFPVKWQFDVEDNHPYYFAVAEVTYEVGTMTVPDENI